MASFPIVEAMAFANIFGTFSGGKFRQVNIVNIHGIRVFLGVDEGGSRLGTTALQGFCYAWAWVRQQV